MSKSIKLKDQVYQKIFNEIIEGHYAQNQIITERELIEKYGVSKSPVREALIELCNEKVLESRPRLGYQICPISIMDISDTLELRIILETAALEQTFSHLEDSYIEQLKANISESSKMHHEKNIAKHWSGNISFHLLLCSFCGNKSIYQELERALKFCSRGASQYFLSSWKKRRETTAQRHILLIEAMEKRELESAKKILREDILDLKREIVEDLVD